MQKVLLITVVLFIPFLTGCESLGGGKVHDFVKDVEGKAYDSVADAVTKYCKGKTKDGTFGEIAKQEALELRREIRQRGGYGPLGPMQKPEYLDDKTAYGTGPVVRIWCNGEPVPENVWWDFVRIK